MKLYKKLALYLVGYKLIFYFCAAVSFWLLPPIFDKNAYLANFHWPQASSPPTDPLLYLKTWDSQCYLYLSQMGYSPGHLTNVSFPLWPFLIEVFSFVFFGSHFWSGLIISNIFSIAGLLLFFKLVYDDAGEETAYRSLILILAFPASIFFSFIYSEPLFFFLTAMFFVYLKRSRYEMASIFSFLMTLARPMGIFSILPLGYEILRRKSKWRDWLCMAGPLFGLAVYFLVMHLWAGGMFEGVKAQRQFVFPILPHQLLDAGRFLKSFFTPAEEVGNFAMPVLNRIWFVWFVLALCLLWRRDKTYFVYALSAGLFPAVAMTFAGYGRYLLPVFPIFFVTARWFCERKLKYFFIMLVAVLCVLQVFFLIRQINNYWVC